MKRDELKVKIFADGADAESIFQFAKLPYVKGITTNPSLMRQAGVVDYKQFMEKILNVVQDIPVSFEVFADDMEGMYKQATEISKFGENVYVKIPIVNSKGESTAEVISSLGKDNVPLNVTAIMSMEQVEDLLMNIVENQRLILSIFAGRIADTGRDARAVVQSSVGLVKGLRNIEVLWASTREVYNIIQAEEAGCQIITMTYALIKKLDLLGKNLNDYSRETAEMFYSDAVNSGYKI